MPFPIPPVPFPMPLLFITAVTDICAINTFEKLLKILFSEVYRWHFGFTTPLFSATSTDMSLYEVLTLFPYWPLVFRSFLLARRSWCNNSHYSPNCWLFLACFLITIVLKPSYSLLTLRASCLVWCLCRIYQLNKSRCRCKWDVTIEYLTQYSRNNWQLCTGAITQCINKS